jgi:hypothetical protein
MTVRARHVLCLVAALPFLGGSICGEVLADLGQRELVLDPVQEIAFEVDSGAVEVYAFNRNGTSLFYYLVGSLYDIGTVDWAVDGDALEVVSLCDSTEHCTVSWYAEIPFGVGVDVQAHDGDVKITGVDAPITADVDSGGFTGAHLRTPTVDVAAESGDVTIEMYVPPTDLRVAVGEGNVELTLPPGSYRCELATNDGDVDTTGVACDPMATAVITVDVDVGDIVLLPGELP